VNVAQQVALIERSSTVASGRPRLAWGASRKKTDFPLVVRPLDVADVRLLDDVGIPRLPSLEDSNSGLPVLEEPKVIESQLRRGAGEAAGSCADLDG
jgi:hypothetical protein